MAGGGGKSGGAGSGGSAGASAGAGGGGACTPTTQTLAVVLDANLNAAAPTANYAYVAEVRIVRGGTATSERAVFWFDFSAVPAGIEQFSHAEVIYLFDRVPSRSSSAALATRATTRVVRRSASWLNAERIAPTVSVRPSCAFSHAQVVSCGC
jgi:hypothetical protein